MGFRLPQLIFLALYPLASGACPVKFQTQSAASLKPTPTSHIVLLKQNDGSYTGYEITDVAPYTVLKTTPNFQNQLTVCPPPPGGAGPLAPPQAFAHLASGGYLFAQRSDVFNTPGGYFSVYLLQFDASLRLTSSANLTLSAGPQNPGIATTLTLADVNGDGKPDLIAGTSYPHSYGLQILLGTGGTGFQTPTLYSVSNYNIESVVVADVNGDNKPDLVVAGTGFGAAGFVSVFLGNGDGTFQAEKVVAKIRGLVSGVAIGDLNGDGKPDLAFPTNYEVPAVLVALGNGDGTFSNPVSYPSNGSDSIAIGDVNGDGFPDIVASGVTILFGDGTGAFPNRRDYVQQTAGNVILTDIDGDGKTDIVIGTGASWILSGTAVAVLYGHGDGTFSGAPISPVPGLPAIDNEVTALKSADLDGDGIPDLVYSDLETGITALHGDGDGTFKVTWQHNPRIQDNIPSGFASSITIGDFNRDGIPDFAAEIESFSTGMLEVFLGVGDGTFHPPALIPLGSSLGDYLSMAVADFNGDGKLDLALVTTPWPTGGAVSSSILILLGNGDGTFASPLVPLTGPGYFTIAAGDFNNDGVPDLAVATDGSLSQTSSGVSILLGNGDGTFRTASVLTISSIGHTLVAADFNLDGKLDLAVSTANPRSPQVGLAILLGTGDGGMQPPISYSLNSYSLNSNGLTAGDLNGDGIPDLVTDAGYLLGNGDGTLQPPVALGFSARLIADFNGDGQPDLAGPTGLGIATMLNISRPTAFTVVSSASFQPGPVAPESLVSAFGTGFGPSASTTTLTVQDAFGITRSASVLFVSPTQVNFEIPAGTSPGAATVVLTNAASSTSFSAPAQILPVAPGLFTLNKAGLVAAYVVRVSGGAKTIEPIFTLQNNAVFPAPIDLGPPGDQVYLSFFGTGIRNAASGGVSVRINGANAPVTYAGSQTVFPGLDQVNVQLPRQLAGSGQAGVLLTAAGRTANPAYVFFK